jgi:hypothetical protein
MNTLLAAAQQAAPAAAWQHTGIDSIVAGNGVTIAFVGILVVFSALAFIALVISLTKRLSSHRKKTVEPSSMNVPRKNGVSGEVVAAIALALGEYLFEVHDEERTILTINKVSKPYSPWSSKLYGMTPRPYQKTINR